MKYAVVLLQKTENGLHVTIDEDSLDEPNRKVLTIEATGATRSMSGMGPKRGWNEVVVTDKDGQGRTGWCPWNPTGPKEELPISAGRPDTNFWIVWNLGAYGPDTND